MIKGRVRQRLTKEAILSQISEWEIYRYFWGRDFKLGKNYSSPMPGRRDSSPSFNIEQIGGHLFHCDFGAMQYRGNCFDFVMQVGNCSFSEALESIDKAFGLGIAAGGRFHIRKAPVYKVPKLEEKAASFIQFKGTQKFNALETAYWNSYRCSFDILKRENVYAVRSLYIDREKFPLPKDEPVFAYYEPGIQKTKIYRPYANKEKKEWKWRSTIPFIFQHGLDGLGDCGRLFIAKSQKDRLMMLHHTDFVTAVQGESMASISEEDLARIRTISKEQVVVFGSDPQGVEACTGITEQLGMKYFNIPKHHLEQGINDPAELVKHYGHEKLAHYLMEKQLLEQYSLTG